MRFVKAVTAAGDRIGVLDAADVVHLAERADRIEPYLGDDGEALHRLGESILAAPAAEFPLAGADLRAPVDPPSLRDFMVFEEHAAPTWRATGLDRTPDVWYQRPLAYFSNVATLRGPRDPVEVPGGSSQLDYELEIGAVTGREARSVTPEAAAGLIAGYLVLCDWSARDLQSAEIGGFLGPFKGKDFASSLGPMLVTPDELADRRQGTGYDLRMTASVNGRVYGSDSWTSAYWSFEELISYASWNSRVEAGALIGSGTCQGGCIKELSLRHGEAGYPWLAAGDEVRLSVERLGEVAARVREAVRPAWPGYREAPAPATCRRASI
jgi:2-keto-4-pentenoate hydratase/2-oxohepta-3-ene-1,7-dioic acid hydratase in catechol pathway